MIQKAKFLLLIITITSLTIASDIKYAESECNKMLDDFYILLTTFEDQRQIYKKLKDQNITCDQEYKKAEELWKKVILSKHYIEKHCYSKITLTFE